MNQVLSGLQNYRLELTSNDQLSEIWEVNELSRDVCCWPLYRYGWNRLDCGSSSARLCGVSTREVILAGFPCVLLQIRWSGDGDVAVRDARCSVVFYVRQAPPLGPFSAAIDLPCDPPLIYRLLLLNLPSLMTDCSEPSPRSP